MSHLTSAAWIAHDLGLATTIGGTLFGQGALHPALRERLDDDQQSMLVADAAWRRFSWLNLAAHAVFAATWLVGRSMLSGREVSKTGRTLTRVKDGLVIASLITGISSIVLGRVLGKKMRERERGNADQDSEIARLRKAVSKLGKLNLLATAGIGAVTTGLSMEASKSLPFSYVSRRLP
jgi:uncharacterized membrane protein